MAGMKRNPDNFLSEGPGGAMHRFDELSKADWADAYADLYRQCFGELASPEDILADAEHRDDIRRTYAEQPKKKRPTPCSQAQREYHHHRAGLFRMRRAALAGDRRYDPSALTAEINALDAAWKADQK